MENLLLKKPYEISVWEDFTPSEDKRYYREKKLMIIGSNTMNSPIRAVSPSLTENVNGTHTLSFTLYNNYFDEEEDKYVTNPFLAYLTNERKVKLKYNGKWYDFIVKNIEENSEDNSFRYTLVDSFINELSKTGFNIEISEKQENAIGTVKELAGNVLKASQTDWCLGEVELFRQTQEEPLLPYTLEPGQTITAVNLDTLLSDNPERITLVGKDTPKTIIYVFYGCAINPTEPVQFLYREDGLYTVDDDGVINNCPNYRIETGSVSVNVNGGVSDVYRGDRLIQAKQSTIDPNNFNAMVEIFEDEKGETVYRTFENHYFTSEIVQNLMVNSDGFADLNCWTVPTANSMEGSVYPWPGTYSDIETKIACYLRMKFNSGQGILNNAFPETYKQLKEGIIEGNKYVFRVLYGVNSDEKGCPTQDYTNNLRAKIARYSFGDDGNFNMTGADEIVSFINSTPVAEDDIDPYSGLKYVYFIAEAKETVSANDLRKEDIGIFLSLKTPNSTNYFMQSAQMFPYVEDMDGKVVVPGEAPTAGVKAKYYYYYPSQNKDIKEPGDMVYAYVGYDPAPQFKYRLDDSFEKRNSIEEKDSNVFNIIQSICEKFECWAEFEVEHEEDGTIRIDEDGPIKRINFRNYVGRDNYSGFKYGINLKSIRRSIDSEQIVTKLIVLENSNQNADGGFCRISKAEANPNRVDWLLNFKYYIQQGLLSANEVNNDLYLYTEGGKYLGYYVQLQKIRRKYLSYEKELDTLSSAMSRVNSAFISYKAAYDAQMGVILENQNFLKNFCGVDYVTLISNKDKYANELANSEVQKYIKEIQAGKSLEIRFKAASEARENELNQLESRYNFILDDQGKLKEQEEELNRTFYKKYSRYIQEGSWISEDYRDPNEYYFDAEKTLNTSAVPEISYTIDVMELSSLPDYENYNFGVGDKTYIEDTEFFGWVYDGEIKTPYKEEIVVSEVTYNLDEPENNTIKVQNYKTQFEDLFQRITAVTQQLQFNGGRLDNASDAFGPGGALDSDSIKNGLINNDLIIQNSQNQSVTWDETGITVVNLAKPNEIVRIVSGGILLTTDGGEHWGVGVTGGGINTAYLTAGQIDASKINIISGGFPCFRWDKRRFICL